MFGRFARYIERRWDFLDMLKHVRDSRQIQSIPTSAIFLSVFGMHSVRLGSLNGMEQQLQIPGRWEPLVGPVKPSAEAVAYAMERYDPEPLRMMLAGTASLAKRKKAFKRLYPDTYWGIWMVLKPTRARRVVVINAVSVMLAQTKTRSSNTTTVPQAGAGGQELG